jgi:hypothetical protein
MNQAMTMKKSSAMIRAAVAAFALTGVVFTGCVEPVEDGDDGAIDQAPGHSAAWAGRAGVPSARRLGDASPQDGEAGGQRLLVGAAAAEQAHVAGRPGASRCVALAPLGLESGGELGRGCYLVEETIRVRGGELVLAAGARLVFAPGAGLDVGGGARLMARGTPASPVVLTGETREPGAWKGVRLGHDADAGARLRPHRLTHAVVEYAGGSRWGVEQAARAGITVWGARAAVELTDTQVLWNAHAGISATSRHTLVRIEGGRFGANARTAILHPEHAGALGAGVQTPDVGAGEPIELTGGQVTGEVVMPAHRAGWRVTGVVRVAGSLTMKPGAHVAFGRQAGVDVTSGQLRALGEPGARIWLVSDESARAEGEPGRGLWRGVRVGSSAANALSYVTIESAGRAPGWGGAPGAPGAASVLLAPRARLAMTRVDLDYGAGAPVALGARARLAPCAGVTVAAPGQGPVDLSALGCQAP